MTLSDFLKYKEYFTIKAIEIAKILNKKNKKEYPIAELYLHTAIFDVEFDNVGILVKSKINSRIYDEETLFISIEQFEKYLKEVHLI